MAKEKHTSLFGKGTPDMERNPAFPHETAYDGGSKGIVSPHGSNFAMKVHNTNVMDEALAKHRGGPGGSTTDSLDTNMRKGTS